MGYRDLLNLSKDARRNLVIGPFGSLVSLTVFVPLLSATSIVGSGGSILGWRIGVAMWLLSLAFLFLTYLISFRRLKARTYYAVGSISRMPFLIAFLDAGIRILGQQLPDTTMILIGVGLLVGLVGLPWSIRARRRWFQVAVDRGHLQWSLDRSAAEWDPSHDMDKYLADERIAQPGCFMRLLPWIGPAIGLSLARIFGQANALVIMGIISLVLGYGFLYTFTTYAVAYSMDFARLNRQVGEAIYVEIEA